MSSPASDDDAPGFPVTFPGYNHPANNPGEPTVRSKIPSLTTRIPTILVFAILAAALGAQEPAEPPGATPPAAPQAVAPPPAAPQPTPLQRAEALLLAEDWAGAAAAFAAITEAEPENPDAFFGLGAARYGSRQVDLAIPAYLEAFELGYRTPQAHYHLARAYAAKGEDAAALEWLDKLAAFGPPVYEAIDTTEEFGRLRDTPEFAAVLERTRPCSAPPYRKLDFWLGSWNVLVGKEKNQLAGTNRIHKILNGCALIENWTDNAGAEGKSLFYYDEHAKRWKQVWITDSQRHKEKHLIAELGGGAVRFQGELPQADGRIVLDRTTLYPLPSGEVRQVIEQSFDGGDTWRVGFDALYVPQE